MKLKRRHWLVLAALATAALVWFAPEDDEPVPAKHVRRGPTVGTKAGGTGARDHVRERPAAELTLASRETEDGEVPDLFRSTSWYVPPPPPPVPDKPPPPPPPSAPPLPFIFMGQYSDDQRHQIILARGDRVVTATVGEDIDKNYRLEALHNGVLTFVYLPLDIRQTLNIGNTQ